MKLGRIAKQVVPILSISVAAIAISTAQAGGSQRASGIYLESPDHASDPMRLETTMPMMQVDGLAKTMLTGGLLKPHMVTRLSGESSAHRASTQPTFLFVFNEPPKKGQTVQSNPGTQDMSGMPVGLSSPKDFALVRLTVADGQRQNDTGKMDKVKIDTEKLSALEYRVRPSSPLAPGEYGFAPGGGSGGMLWDFGVDAPK